MEFDSILRIRHPDYNLNAVRGYLRRCLHATNEFFGNRPSIITAKADKGNIMIVMSRESYFKRMEDIIGKCLEDGIYEELRDLERVGRKQKIEGERIDAIFRYEGKFKHIQCLISYTRLKYTVP